MLNLKNERWNKNYDDFRKNELFSKRRCPFQSDDVNDFFTSCTDAEKTYVCSKKCLLVNEPNNSEWRDFCKFSKTGIVPCWKICRNRTQWTGPQKSFPIFHPVTIYLWAMRHTDRLFVFDRIRNVKISTDRNQLSALIFRRFLKLVPRTTCSREP